MKLNVGCGKLIMEGYVNVDIRAAPGVDVVASVTELTRHLEAETIEEIFARHVLEHVPPDEARIAVREMWTILKHGGRAEVIVPDLEFHARQLLGLVTSSADNQRRHAFAGFFGWRRTDLGGDVHDAHHWGYDERELRELFEGVPFASIERRHKLPSWHLHMIATK